MNKQEKIILPTENELPKVEVIPAAEEFEKMSERIAQDREEMELVKEENAVETEHALEEVREELYAKNEPQHEEVIAQEEVVEQIPAVEPVKKAGFFKKIAAAAAFLGIFGGAPDAQAVDKKEDPFIVRAGRTVGKVSTSIAKHTVEGVVEDVKTIAMGPVILAEAATGRDFKKHEDIGPTERVKKAGKVLGAAGSVATGVFTGGISTVGFAAGGEVVRAVGKTTTELNPALKRTVEKYQGNDKTAYEPTEYKFSEEDKKMLEEFKKEDEIYEAQLKKQAEKKKSEVKEVKKPAARKIFRP